MLESLALRAPLLCQQHPSQMYFLFLLFWRGFIFITSWQSDTSCMRYLRMWRCGCAIWLLRWARTCWRRRRRLACLSVSASIYFCLCLFTSPLCQTWGWSLIFFFFSFYVKIMFGFAFFLYMWLGLSLLPSSVEGAGNQPVKIVAFPVSMQNLFNYRKCCLKSLKASKSIFVLFIMYHIWIGVKY